MESLDNADMAASYMASTLMFAKAVEGELGLTTCYESCEL